MNVLTPKFEQVSNNQRAFRYRYCFFSITVKLETCTEPFFARFVSMKPSVSEMHVSEMVLTVELLVGSG